MSIRMNCKVDSGQRFLTGLLTCSLLFFYSCSQNTSPDQSTAKLPPPYLSGQMGLNSSPHDGAEPPLKLGAQQLPVPVMKMGSELFIEVEALLSKNAFSSLGSKTLVTQKINSILSQLKKENPVVVLRQYPNVGYFKILVPIKRLGGEKSFPQASSLIRTLFPTQAELLKGQVVLSPAVRIRPPQPINMADLAGGMISSTLDDNDGPSFFGPRKLFEGITDKFNHPNKKHQEKNHSGLHLMKTFQFIQMVESELENGHKIDGSTVRVGITDTGITYNHPIFHNDKKQSRIVYMNDFTGEGRVYFHPTAKFDLGIDPSSSTASTSSSSTEHNSYIIHSAQVIPPTIGIMKPAANVLLEVTNEKILLSAELKEILTQPLHGAKLGAMSESSFGNQGEQVDINANGKTNDQFWMILVPKKSSKTGSDELYVSFEGNLDFTKAIKFTDWNNTKKSHLLHAERLAFTLAPTNLPLVPGLPSEATNEDSSNDPTMEEATELTVMAASLVGFDPGQHGTHVAGISSGRNLFSNDDSLSAKARGMAPNSQILMNRVCANNGGCFSNEAIIDLAQQGVDVINMSLGGLGLDNDGYDVQSLLIDRLSEEYGVQFMISAGNEGPGHQTVGSPSVSRHALSIGAAASPGMMLKQLQFPAYYPPFKEGVLSSSGSHHLKGDLVNLDEIFVFYFSSRGPSAAGAFKPELLAPGSQLSAVPFHTAPGHSTSGLDSFWGTSMAAPAATGAYALLLDAARKYNQRHQGNSEVTPLPTDALTLRRVLLESARRISLKTHQAQGEYTWVDQGLGMIDLVRAWKILLKQAPMQQKNASFYLNATTSGNPDDSNNRLIPVVLDYDIRISQDKNRHGLAYNGVGDETTGQMSKWARGLWIDPSSTQSLYRVFVERKVPSFYQKFATTGELKVLTDTSRDEFILKTELHGSTVPWFKITEDRLPCFDPSVPSIKKMEVSSRGTNNWSRINVCVNPQLIKTLPPGDHGVLVRAYRTKNGKTEAVPSFILPVYINIPHQIVKNAAENRRHPDADTHAFDGDLSTTFRDTVRAFEVKKYTINIPEGLKYLKITLEVPAAAYDEKGNLIGCSGVYLQSLEGAQIYPSPELQGSMPPSVKSCNEFGIELDENKRVLQLERMNPRAGTWDLSILGLFRYPLSEFKLKIDYTQWTASISEIKGGPSALQGRIDMNVDNSSVPVVASEEKSFFQLTGKLKSITTHIKEKEEKLVVQGKTYAAETTPTVTYKIVSATGSQIDLDLHVYECVKPMFSTLPDECSSIAQGVSSSYLEEVHINPQADKYYFVQVQGYSISLAGSDFVFQEIAHLKDPVPGVLEFLTNDGSLISLIHQFNLNHPIFAEADFKQGEVKLTGKIEIISPNDSNIALFPVEISVANE